MSKHGRGGAGSAHLMRVLWCGIVIAAILLPPVNAAAQPVPAANDPGTPRYRGAANPVPAEPADYDPSTSMLADIYASDVARGDGSYWFDKLLERPYLPSSLDIYGNNDASLYTRGRALYMLAHNAETLGFAGGYAYREQPTGGNQSLYTINVGSARLVEDVTKRRQYPSHWTSEFASGALLIGQRKFITHNNTAVTVLKITNRGIQPQTPSVSVTSPIATSPVAGAQELTGSVTARYDVTTITPRLSGDGMTVSGTTLSRDLSLPPGASVTLKIQLGAITREIPESVTEYERYRDVNPEKAFADHVDEYNRWWVENVPYIDVPDANVKKMSYYRTFLNRYNTVDANIPGNDYQFPVSLEGVLGYNNAIQLTQPMHMQDLKYFRNPMWSYGNWLSSGETSKCTAFTDNPGSHSWGNTYEQYIAREAWNAYKVHGGEPAIVDRYAYYSECDVKGQLRKYDTNNNYLIEYDWGSLTGNDADAVALAYYNEAPQDRTESAFWYSGAKAAAEAYHVLGKDAKAAEMESLAGNIREAILSLLWDPRPAVPLATQKCYPDPQGQLCGGKAFKQRDVEREILVPWKDQQNFSPFAEGVVPNTEEYKQALRFYADGEEFPIMPFFTANQRDKKEATGAGRAGTNNFSNINSTLQAQLYSAALRHYPSQHITPLMYRQLLEWLTWTQYIAGDNRYPDNNEFFYAYEPATQSVVRSWIHHNILGAFNFMIIDDIAGLRPRLDETIELWPIDVGYDRFTVNNLNYHGSDVSIVWDKPGDGAVHYGGPEGYSLYVDGRRAFTIDRLAHVQWNSATGSVDVLDDSAASVLASTPVPLTDAAEVRLAGNARIVDMFQKAGVDLSLETRDRVNVARGRPVTASYTTTTPALRATAPEFAVDGSTVSGMPAARGSHYIAPNTIWGTEGSPNSQDWLEVDLQEPTTVDTVKLYYYSDKRYSTQQNGSGNTYREPKAYTVQYHTGTAWADIPSQNKSPSMPWPNYNKVEFAPVTTQRLRVVLTPTAGYGVGIKEIQVFGSGGSGGGGTDPDPGGGGGGGEDPGEEDGTNIARSATPSASFTSSWETVTAINDGAEPANSNDTANPRWGTWPVAGAHWVQLDWPTPVTIDTSRMYWFQDSPDGSNSGVKRPLSWSMQYWDGTRFVDVSNPSGYGTNLDAYNATTFDTVTTTRLRALLIGRTDALGVGALEWKVGASEEDS